MAVQPAIDGDVFDCVFLVLFVSREVTWMRTGTELDQILRFFRPTLVFIIPNVNALSENTKIVLL